MIVAIDGPAGAGKSTVAKTAARALGFAYIDTGALYRAVGLAVMRGGGNPAREEDALACLPGISLDVRYARDGAQLVLLGEDDVSESIRTPEASMASSNVAKVPAVREFLLEMQRGLARAQNSILDGRDIGTVVLPEAEVKIFLTASPEERARRRWLELQSKGADEPYDKVLAEVIARDKQDSSRAVAPLRPAADSILLDSSSFDLAQSIQAVVDIIQARRAA